MQFITTGNRIAVENFVLGDLYTITFTNGTYINSACIGIGENFVSFQRNEPELLFSLTMATAELVSSIELYTGGTDDYNELTNKPQINGVELVGNKSLSALGIQPEITEESPLSSSLVSGLGSAAAADTTDFATAAQGALAASAVQPATMEAALALKQDALSTAQLTAVNSGITSSDVAQITTNKNNISSVAHASGAKNKVNYDITKLKSINTSGTWTDNVYTAGVGNTLSITYNTDNTISIVGTIASQFLFILDNNVDSTVSGDILSGGASPTVLRLQHAGGNYETYANSTGSGATIATIPDGYVSRLIIVIPANQTINVKVSPMICDSALYSIDDAYQPYSMTNAELTAAIQALQAQLANQ